MGWRIFWSTERAGLFSRCSRAAGHLCTLEIAREVDASVGAVQRELEKLSKLILRKRGGTQLLSG
jgi:hypothetical protein